MNKDKAEHKTTLAAVVATSSQRQKSAFSNSGFSKTIALLLESIADLYCADDVPWIVGYSGGKDSTATLQLIWMAIAALSPEKRTKRVHVVTTDTMVENPIVSSWVEGSLSGMRLAAEQQNVPITPHLLRPRVEESFWVNLIGKGYPAPRPKFRWCTERLKIKPSNRFISEVVSANGQAILCLGARKSESIARARVFERSAKHRTRDYLSPSESLPGCLVYTPVETWSNDDVWIFLTNVKNPWGISNKDLMRIYAGASPDGECPLVVDTSTPSCGDSRFGCWVCTLVEKDKSMTAMIQNDADKEWMLPLLELRNALDARGTDISASDHHLRDFRRMSGAVQLMANGNPVPGPYTQDSRHMWLTKLLQAQAHIRKTGPEAVRSIELITLEELEEIRRIWVMDKHEIEDLLPMLYEQATGSPYPGPTLDDDTTLSGPEMELLQQLCGTQRLHYELARELISLTRQQKHRTRRAGHFDELENAFRRHSFDDERGAVELARTRKQARTLESVESELNAVEINK